MLKSILAFGLTHRTIVMMGVLVFIGGGLIAFSELNIEAYPNPAPVILEITAQAAGLSAEEMEQLLYDAYGDRPLSTRRASTTSARPRSMACPSSGSRSSTASIISLPTPRRPSACNRTSRCRRIRFPQIQQSSLVGRDVSLSGGRAAAFRPDQSPHRAGLGHSTPADPRSRASRQINSWGGTTKEFDVEADLGQGGSLRHHDSADDDRARQCQHQCWRA